MEVNEFTGATNAQFATAGNWSKAHKPTTTEQAFIPAGKTCEIKTAVEPGALKVRGKLTVTAAGAVTTAGIEAAPGNALIDTVGAESVAWNAGSGGITLAGSVATAQTIATGGFPIARLSVAGPATGKWQLIEALTTNNTTGKSLLHGGKGTLEFNGQIVTGQNVECAEGSKADFTNAVFKCSGEGGAFMLSNTGTTFTGLASATVEVSERTAGELSPSKQLNGAGKEIGTIIITGFNVTLESVTWKELRVENSGCAAGKGCKLKSGGTFTDSVITANGTEGAPARLESSTAGIPATLTMPEQELAVGFLAIKDLTIGTGPWYVPLAHGKNEGGNTVVGTTIKFEAKPAGKKTGEGSAALTAGASQAAAGIRLSSARVGVTGGAVIGVTGRKLVRGSAAVSAGALTSAKGSRLVSTSVVVAGGAVVTARGVRFVSSNSTLSAGARIATSGARTANSSTALTAGCRLGTTSVRVTAGASVLTSAPVIATASRVIVISRSVVTAGARINVTAGVIGEGAGLLRGGVRVATTGVAVATGRVALTSGAGISSTSSTVAVARVVLRAGAAIFSHAHVIVNGSGYLQGSARVLTASHINVTGAATISAGGVITVSGEPVGKIEIGTGTLTNTAIATVTLGDMSTVVLLEDMEMGSAGLSDRPYDSR